MTVPLVADGGAGFGEPLHTMRSVREFVRAGVAGIHIEDQLYPKRAHYHKYVAHVTPRDEFVAKIDYACRQRAEFGSRLRHHRAIGRVSLRGAAGGG